MEARFAEPSVLILVSLSDGPKHGYALIKDIEQIAGITLGPGTLYGALARLEQQGHPIRWLEARGAEPVRVRRLTDQEGQRLQQIVRRGSAGSVRYQRAMMLLASAGREPGPGDRSARPGRRGHRP